MLIRPAAGMCDETSRGQTCGALACLADVYPTLCSVAGVSIPASARVDGTDMLAVLEDVSPRANAWWDDAAPSMQ